MRIPAASLTVQSLQCPFSGSFSCVLLQLLLRDGLGISHVGGACGGDAALARDAVARDPTAKRLVPEDARQPKTRGRGIGHLYELSRVLA